MDFYQLCIEIFYLLVAHQLLEDWNWNMMKSCFESFQPNRCFRNKAEGIFGDSTKSKTTWGSRDVESYSVSCGKCLQNSGQILNSDAVELISCHILAFFSSFLMIVKKFHMEFFCANLSSQLMEMWSKPKFYCLKQNLVIFTGLMVIFTGLNRRWKCRRFLRYIVLVGSNFDLSVNSAKHTLSWSSKRISNFI